MIDGCRDVYDRTNEIAFLMVITVSGIACARVRTQHIDHTPLNRSSGASV